MIVPGDIQERRLRILRKIFALSIHIARSVRSDPAARNGRLDEHPATDPPDQQPSVGRTFFIPVQRAQDDGKNDCRRDLQSDGNPRPPNPGGPAKQPGQRQQHGKPGGTRIGQSQQTADDQHGNRPSGSRRPASPAYRPDRQTGADDPANGQVTAVRPRIHKTAGNRKKVVVGRKYVQPL